MKTVKDLLAECAFFEGLEPRHLESIAGCASNAQFKAGDFIFREGEIGGQFYVLRAGKVAVEISVAGRGPTIIQTLQEGEVLSWSWMVPPYKKHFDARAIELTRAVAFDGECVRRQCDADPALGYELWKRFAVVIEQRLHATRLQLMDLYAQNP